MHEASDPTIANLFARAPVSSEQFETLWAHPRARIERIWGPVDQPSGVYDQDHDEWVVLLSGLAQLEVDAKNMLLHAGDHIVIPAHRRHRVLSASPDALWLAVHVPTPDLGPSLALNDGPTQP